MERFNDAELGYHRISRVRTLKIRNRYTRLNGKNSRRAEHAYGGEFIVKELTTDQGAMGWGLFPGVFWKPDKEIDSVVKGRTVAELFDINTGVTDEKAMKFDFALHDLAGNILRQPVFRLLGNNGSNPVPCYDGAILMDDISPDSAPGGLKAILDECTADYALGYRSFKLKIGRAPKWMELKDGIKRDIEVTRLVREYFPDCAIMVDANDAYTPETMKKYVDGVADCSLFWIEEPFREEEAGFRILREYLDEKSPSTLIADGESYPDVEQLFSLADAGLLGVLQMDIAGYGFTAWRKLMPRVAQSGARISPHNWGYKIKTHYTAAFAAGYPGVNTIEGVIDETEGVDISSYSLHNGRMLVPEKAGFGMELIWGEEL